jgi:hypothetical protein
VKTSLPLQVLVLQLDTPLPLPASENVMLTWTVTPGAVPDIEAAFPQMVPAYVPPVWAVALIAFPSCVSSAV